MYGRYKCSVCGCSLDPGEGDMCDDCKRKDALARAVDNIRLSTNYPLSSSVTDLFDMKHKVDIVLRDAYRWSDKACSAFQDKLALVTNGDSGLMLEYYDKVFYALLKGIDLGVDNVDELFSLI